VHAEEQGGAPVQRAAIVDTDNLGKTFRANALLRGLSGGAGTRPVRALHAVTIRVHRGEVLGLVGPNGAGKTTLLKILATLLTPSEGRARLAGSDVVDAPGAVRRAVGLASGEDRGFYWRLSGRDNLEFFGQLLGLSPRAASARVGAVLELVDLLPRAGESVFSYSTGMRQRLGIARALLGDPSVLLLDEPTRSLDPVAASETQALVNRLARDRHATVLLATHNLDEAERICDRVAILVDGTVRAMLSPALAGKGELAGRYRTLVEAPA
jgi:ABC-2 type transport system ATP-binding protein